MPTILQLRRGTTAENAAYTGSVGELTVDTTLTKLILHDGSTAGGVDVGDITSIVAGAGMTGGGTEGDATLNVIGGTGITANANDVEIDTSIVTTLTGSQTLTNKTITSPTVTSAVLNTAVSGSAVLDEDNMASDSATQLATQQSIKAYVDSVATAADLDLTTDSGTIDIDLDAETLTIAGGTGIDSSASGTTATLAIDSTVATLTGSQTLTNKTLTSPVITGTGAIASGAITATNLTLSGDLTVNGTTTTVASTNTTIADNLLELNSGAGSNANDTGILIERGSTGDNAIIAWDESADKFTVGTTTATADSTGNITISTGTLVANIEGNVTGDVTGNADTATTLETARTIGGVSFDGSANIAVNLAATATTLATARTIGGTSFDGSANIAVGLAATATALASARTIAGQSFDGSANITIASTDLSNTSAITLNTATQTLTNKTIDANGTGNSLTNIDSGNFLSGFFLDEDNLASDSATAVASQQSIKAYVDAVSTASDLDFRGNSGGDLSIDLDSETLHIEGGTGIDTSGSSNTLTVAIDSTVATLTGTQTLTNKTLTTPILASFNQVSGNNLLTMPAATDTLVGKATTDTLTNKTINTASNTITVVEADISDLQAYSLIAAPVFTGVPAAPTASAGTSTTQLATTAFVATSFAPKASPTFTGTAVAPTPSSGDDSTKIATTAYVVNEFAPLASPTFTGTPAGPTANAGTNTTQVATTAFVAAAISALSDSAPSTLDTLNELAAALGDDANFAATTATALGLKMVKTANLSDLANAGTARTNLGVNAVELQIQNSGGTALKTIFGASS